LSPPLPKSLAPIKLANPGSPGKWPLKRTEKKMDALDLPEGCKCNYA